MKDEANKPAPHGEPHLLKRVGWLRAAVLGANDGILSTASLVSGVAAAGASRNHILLAGIAGLVAGAGSMATGEYVSVSSQSDTETADLAREKKELAHNPKFELEELTQIYTKRGVERTLALQVATQLTDHDALGAHARDELGISEITTARPIQAALTSALCFTSGAVLPLFVAGFAPPEFILSSVVAVSLVCLAVLGALGAKTGGVGMVVPTLRVLLWGAVSLGVTMLVGHFFPVGP